MPEYVYALHDFQPEHEDEIAFNAGDRIEVVEKDDMYGDGWWQGRNLFGKVGLFPQSYTTSDPSVFQPPPSQGPTLANGQAPSSSGPGSAPPADASGTQRTPLQTLNEESDVGSVSSLGNKKNAVAEETGVGDGVMRATLTDVQEAIEQLGRNRQDRDGGGSFSFASTRDGDTTDRELDTDRETDNELGEGGSNEVWQRGARSGLAEKARIQQQQQQKLQEQEDAELRSPELAAAALMTEPPIQFEMSDESEAEEEEDQNDVLKGMQFPRREHAHISEEDEEDEDPARPPNGRHANVQASALINGDKTKLEPSSADGQPSEEFIVPERDDVDAQTATARQVSFPTETTEIPHQDGVVSSVQVQAAPHLVTPSLLTPTSSSSSPSAPSTNNEASASLARAFSEPEPKNKMPQAQLPSPPATQNGIKVPSTPPSEWSVDEVVEWARSKGFDNTVCDKFIEHEISGDVLMELDANILKTELEIHAFGKRTRIMKEIAELRRPPSITSSDARALSQTHSHTFSQSISLPSSAHHSLNSPLTNIMSPESPPHTGDMVISSAPMTFRRDSDPGSSSMHVSSTDHDPESTANNSMVGLGLGAAASVLTSSAVGSIGNLEPTKAPKNRPAYLNLSPSDNSLSIKAKAAKFSPRAGEEDRARDERTVLSDSESTQALDSRTKRRRIFGRSTGSAHSDSKDTLGRTSKDATTPVSSVPGSPSTKVDSFDDGSTRNHQRRKRSVDASKQHDRLSLFGGSLSLGRSRKPAPRVNSSYAHDDISTEKGPRSLSRLYLGSGSRKASIKSQPGELDKDGRDPAVLRKRTTSLVEGPAAGAIQSGLKAGQSVLEQIGEPDHNGWMMKKGERYNTWKLRYFVLKGPHLYYLQDNSKALTKIKGYINIVGYKVIVDENVNPGRYGFRLIHDTEKTHYFSSDEQIIVREWMKALMKATIGRDYTKPVISSCNIPTIPLAVAQTMNPAPRPPSPSQRDATQKALRRENPNQLSSRDARVLMGLPSGQSGPEMSEAGGPRPDESFFTLESLPSTQELSERGSTTPSSVVSPTLPPVRPSRENRRTSVPPVDGPAAPTELIIWANDYLPQNLRIPENGGQTYSGLALYRLAEAIKGRPSEPPVPDSAFPTGPNDDRLDGLFKLFDFFLDNDIRMGSVSINDVRQGKKDKIVHLLRSLKAWEEKRKTIARSIGRSGVHAGPFMALESAPTHSWQKVSP